MNKLQVSMHHYPLSGEHGTRQQWAYDITYASGHVQTHIKSCPSLPVNLKPNVLIDELENLRRQEYHSPFFKSKPVVLGCILKVLNSRHLDAATSEWWINYFESLPNCLEDERYPVLHSYNSLKYLAQNYKRDVQVRSISNIFDSICITNYRKLFFRFVHHLNKNK